VIFGAACIIKLQPQAQTSNIAHLAALSALHNPQPANSLAPVVPEPIPFAAMSEKRPASDDPTERQLVVKRQNVGTSRALTRQGASGSGALIQTVCPIALGFHVRVCLAGSLTV
jgi:hypothetical protein